jgi:hypothetical protein
MAVQLDYRRFKKALNLTTDLFGIKTLLLAIAGLIIIKISSPSHPLRLTLVVYGGLGIAVFIWKLVEAGRVLKEEDTRRNRELHVYKAIKEGRELLSRPPHRDEAVRAVIEGWLEEVKQWEQRTHDFLATFSEQASVTFRDDANLGAKWFANAAQGDTQVWLRILNRRLENLSKVTGQPDAYLKA